MTAEGWLISASGTVNFNQFAKQQDAAQNSQFLMQRMQQQQRLIELEELLDTSDEHIDCLHKQIKRSQSEYDALRISLDESRAQHEQLTREVYDYQQQLATEKAALKQEQADAQRLQSDKLALEHEQQSLPPGNKRSMMSAQIQLNLQL